MSKEDRLAEENLRVWNNYQTPLNDCEATSYLKILRDIHPGILLDIGCADGSLSKKGSDLGWFSVGTDISAMNAKSAHAKGIMALVNQLQSPLPFKNNTFDLVMAKQVIEHLVDTRLFIEEIYRVIRPGGRLLLSTPNLASLSNRLRLLFGYYPGWMDYELGRGSGHVRYYTLSILEQQLNAAGFTIIKAMGTEIPLPMVGRLPPNRRPKMLQTLGERLPCLSVNLIVLAEK